VKERGSYDETQNLSLSQTFPTTDSVLRPPGWLHGLYNWTVSSEHLGFFFLVSSLLFLFFLVLCGRLDCLFVSFWAHVNTVYEGKIGQALEGVLLYAGPWGFYSTITSDQPTGLSGLMSRAEDKGKGKGDFLLVINSNLPPILHRFRDIVFDSCKIFIFSYPCCV